MKELRTGDSGTVLEREALAIDPDSPRGSGRGPNCATVDVGIKSFFCEEHRWEQDRS